MTADAVGQRQEMTLTMRKQKTPAFLVRKAKPEDGDALLTCLAAAFEPYRNQYTTEAFHDTILTPQSVQQRLSAMQP